MQGVRGFDGERGTLFSDGGGAGGEGLSQRPLWVHEYFPSLGRMLFTPLRPSHIF